VIEIFTLILVWAFFRLRRENRELEKRAEGLDKKLASEKEEILKAAQAEGQQLVAQARLKAEQVVRGAQEFGDHSNEELGKLLDSLSQKQVEVSNQVIGRVRDETVQLLQRLVEELKQHTAGEMHGFSSKLNQEFEAARQAAQQTIDTAYGAATKEVEAYKVKRLEQIKRQMTILVREIVEKVLSKSVDQRQHEQLVLEAVEEAKKDGIL
jgi:F0F1-type ATP synthase membrane subunit b/b'